jgi:diguanylate cyclase (GGDEF)-like protein/PAS domain S-box-containing protein
MNPYALLPLCGFFANAIMGTIVLARNPRSSANRLYALLGIATAYWSIVKFARWMVDDLQAAQFLFAVSAPGWCLLPSVYLHFAIVFTRGPKLTHAPTFVRVAHVVGFLFAAAAFVPGLMVRRMVSEPWGTSHVPGPLFAAFTLYLIGMFVGAFVILGRARSRAQTRHERAQYSLVLVGILFPVVGGVVTNMILPIFGMHVVELGEVLSTGNAAITAYAMVRHGLLDVTLEQAADTIIATMGDALLVVNLRGEVVVANSAASKVLGLPPGQIVNQPVLRFVRAHAIRSAHDFVSDEGREIEGELLPEGEANPVPVMLSTSPIRERDGGVSGTVLVAKDIRELRQAMLDLANANARLERQAIVDELTGVANRRHGNRRLHEEFELARRYARPFAVGLIDLDDFKRVNDGFGHQLGDRVLEQVASQIQSVLRGTDVVARWGGDEFFVILGGSDARRARQIGERIIERITTASVRGLDRPIKASLGLATFDPTSPPPDADTLVAQADQALYAAKKAGKARVAEASAVGIA